MESLRLILIILALILIGGIYLTGRMREKKERPTPQWNDDTDVASEGMYEQAERLHEDDIPVLDDAWLDTDNFISTRYDPLEESQLDVLDDDVEDDIDLPEPIPEQEAEPEQPKDDPAPVIVLTLMVQKGRRIRGPLLLRAMKDAGLYHGDMDLFHYAEESWRGPLFSVANILEPGSFTLNEMATFDTPGIAMFMQLPTVLPGGEAFRIMLSKARQLGATLNATLCDGQREPLSDDMLLWLEKKAKQVE